MIWVGDSYLIPLLQGKQALATVLGFGALPWNPSHEVLRIGVAGCLVENIPPTDLPGTLMWRYWCVASFVEEGPWSLVRPGAPDASSDRTTPVGPVWATHELFLDELRQRLGLKRQTYTGAQFTFSTECRACGAALLQGFARCRRCRAIRDEFRGLEAFVADRVGCCCESGAPTDVRDQDGRYYWAPYLIDRVRGGASGNGRKA